MSQSLQLLEQLLTGHELSIDELDDLIKNRVKEDLYIDYKNGDLLTGKKGNETIREYISGFANSSGGILIIGVNETETIPTEVTGCNGHSKGKLDEWASRCLTPIASFFAPAPLFQVINHSKGEVLVCVVQRSLSLVPITENGNIVYYFRLHDQTLKAPDYFMADLLLGRRQQPIFEIEEFTALNFERILGTEILSMDLSFDVRFRAENASLVWANDSRWGIICWEHTVTSRSGVETGKPSSHLLSYLEVKDETFNHPSVKKLVHSRGPISIAKPFDVGAIVVNFRLPLRFESTWFSYTWKAALYFIAQNTLPVWYQIDFSINIDTIKLVEEKRPLISPHDTFRIRRLISERPVVAWEEIKT